jgi:hypothetical protein
MLICKSKWITIMHSTGVYIRFTTFMHEYFFGGAYMDMQSYVIASVTKTCNNKLQYF